MSVATDIKARLTALDWRAIEESLWEWGSAKTPPVLTPAECAGLIALYADDRLFRSRVDMARYKFGVGDYKYFAAPLPPLVEALRVHAYPPLAAIANYVTGCVRQLRSRVGRRADLLEMMEEAAAEALRGGEIIRHLWDFVHKRTPEREPADVNQLVRDVTRLIGVEADEKGIAIHLDLSVDLPRVEVDRVQVEQVLVNLIRNGLEAMHESDPETASLTVRTTMAGPDSPDSIEISVRDHGGGLPADLVDAVFAPFVTTKPNGLGMGLSISRSIAEAHGGRVWLTADSNGATTARFTLPVVAGDRSE